VRMCVCHVSSKCCAAQHTSPSCLSSLPPLQADHRIFVPCTSLLVVFFLTFVAVGPCCVATILADHRTFVPCTPPFSYSCICGRSWCCWTLHIPPCCVATTLADHRAVGPCTSPLAVLLQLWQITALLYLAHPPCLIPAFVAVDRAVGPCTSPLAVLLHLWQKLSQY